MASIVSSKVPTELGADYGKLQEQLHCILKGVMNWDKALLEEAYCENSILKQCLEEKEQEQELGILKNVITQDKALLKEINYKNNILQQQHKHARWWNKVHGSGIREVDIVYRATQNNCYADVLSQQPACVISTLWRWQRWRSPSGTCI